MSEQEKVVRQCRRDIVATLIKIADEERRPYRCQELWRIIEMRERLLRQFASDFQAELERIDRDLEVRFRRKSRYNS